MEFDRVGKYKILGEIGRGTMGRVFKAQDPALGRFVAVKTLTYSLGASEESRKRFHREAQAAAVLAHPNIVTVHDFGEEKGLIYMAMEFLEGKDLRDALTDGDLASLDDKLRVMEQVMAGLAFAHSKGVIHRDLKPANIHIQPNHQVKIVDFGLARLSSSEMTQDGVVLGTPNYMSPEQALGDRIDARSDVFAAGAVFYEALTGRKPFDAESTPGVLYQVVHKKPTPVCDLTPEVPRILGDVVEKALAKDKNARFQSARQMHAALSVARRALDEGRGPNASLAEESSRALREANLGNASDSQARAAQALVEGSAALDVGVAAPSRPPRMPATLSGREKTQASGVVRRPARPPKSKAPLVWGVSIGLLVAAAGTGYLFVSRKPPEPDPNPTAPATDAAKAQVGALTHALVTTQLQLAVRDLEDKNYAAAIDQADKALKLDANNAEARRLRGLAVSRRQELEAAASEAQQAADAGDMEKASLALSRLLELDPRHPAAATLSERLNSVFKTRAEEAGRLSGRARAEAEKAKATGAEAFSQAGASAQEADRLMQQGEFAAATRGFLEARDGFDRARRATVSAAPSGVPAPRGSTPPTAAPAAVASGPSAKPVTTELGSVPAPVEPRAETRSFVAGKTQITTGRGGRIEGFEAADVKTQRMPDFAGQIEFETEPATVAAGDPLVVRVFLANQGKKAIKIRGVAFSTIADGRKAAVPGEILTREVAPAERVIVARWRGAWPAQVSTWSLEAAVTSDRNETATNRLSWQ